MQSIHVTMLHWYIKGAEELHAMGDHRSAMEYERLAFHRAARIIAIGCPDRGAS